MRRGSHGTVGRVSIVAALLLAVLGAVSAFAQSLQPDTSRPTKIGVFLNSVFDISSSRDSYAADIYVWSLSPANGPDPLAQVSFPRAKSKVEVERWTKIDGDILWSVRRFRCDISEEWNLADYPFDLHVVKILIGLYAGASVFPPMELDTANSGENDKSISIGWQLKDFHIDVGTITYPTNFGDPTPSADEPDPWIIATFELHRRGWWLFLKLITGAYVAFAASMLACLMKTNHPPIFSGRMGLQIACLFSIIINHRFTGASMGRDDMVGLLDVLHLTCYTLLFAAIFITLRSRVLNDRADEKGAIRFERRATLTLLAIFLAVNLVVVSKAIFTPPHEDEVTNILLKDK